MALLTTVIPVYNGEQFLRFTLEAVAAQTRSPDRVIIMDNRSTDRTREIVESFSHLRCEWRQNETNVGLLGNLNRCLALAAETDYLHLLMADDLVTPRFYEALLAPLESVPGRALGFSYNDVINSTGQVTEGTAGLPTGAPRTLARKAYLARQASLNTVLLPATIFKTNRQPAPCLFRDLPQTSDCVFLAEWALSSEQIIEVPQYLCHYRSHPANTSISKNLYNLQSSVLDEWKAISTIAAWIQEPPLAHWLRQQKLKCLFAARVHVKADMLRQAHPAYAREVRQATRGTVNRAQFILGKLAVLLRDSIDRARGREIKSKVLARVAGLDRAPEGAVLEGSCPTK